MHRDSGWFVNDRAIRIFVYHFELQIYGNELRRNRFGGFDCIRFAGLHPSSLADHARRGAHMPGFDPALDYGAAGLIAELAGQPGVEPLSGSFRFDCISDFARIMSAELFLLILQLLLTPCLRAEH